MSHDSCDQIRQVGKERLNGSYNIEGLRVPLVHRIDTVALLRAFESFSFRSNQKRKYQ